MLCIQLVVGGGDQSHRQPHGAALPILHCLGSGVSCGSLPPEFPLFFPKDVCCICSARKACRSECSKQGSPRAHHPRSGFLPQPQDFAVEPDVGLEGRRCPGPPGGWGPPATPGPTAHNHSLMHLFKLNRTAGKGEPWEVGCSSQGRDAPHRQSTVSHPRLHL